MPQIVFDIINLIAALIRLLGVAALGVAVGYVAVDMLHKAQTWPLQAAFFLGLAGLVIAMVVFLAPGALGGFGLGFAAAIFIWGMPRKKKEEQE
jgi:membrane protein DedA with SNARE-associated domain